MFIKSIRWLFVQGMLNKQTWVFQRVSKKLANPLAWKSKVGKKLLPFKN